MALSTLPSLSLHLPSFCIGFRFMILVTATILHSKCMRLWAFDFSHVDELVLLLR
jgi:hypothetical protein